MQNVDISRPLHCRLLLNNSGFLLTEAEVVLRSKKYQRFSLAYECRWEKNKEKAGRAWGAACYGVIDAGVN